MLVPVHDRENRDGAWLDVEKYREGEAMRLCSTDVAGPRRVESRVVSNARPAGFDLAEELQPESGPLEFVPEKLGLQFELSAPTDA